MKEYYLLNTKYTMPIYWTNEKKTKKDTTHLIGMNFYRNAYHHVQNKMKKDIQELLSKNHKYEGTIEVPYKLKIEIYWKTPSCDGSNINALVEKFFLDYLQAEGITQEDNVKWHKGTSWEVVEQDKENPRAEITIIPV